MKTFLKSSFFTFGKTLEPWAPLLVSFAMALISFVRFSPINPVILGDEYIYLLNSTSGAPWTTPGGDFSNYLFNFIQQPISLCGTAAYSCGKALNAVFLWGSLMAVNAILSATVPLWVRLGTIVAVGLSPIAIYSSLMLPETLFNFLALSIFALLIRFANSPRRGWLISAALILGLATLTKPHAWLLVIPIGIWLIIHYLHVRWTKPREFLLSLATAMGALLVLRLGLGLVIGGPQSLGITGSYSAPSFGTGGSESEPNLESASADSYFQALVTGVWGHLGDHAIAIQMVSGVAVGVLVAVSISKEQRSETRSVGVLGLVTLSSLAVVYSIFSSWVTLAGDDHSTRLLFRYYEFAILLVILLAVKLLAGSNSGAPVSFAAKVALALFAASLTVAFGSSRPSQLSVQIADAPLFAGLIVDVRLLAIAPVVGLLAYVALILFWKISLVRRSIVVASLIIMAAMGINTVDQYQNFRAKEEPQDVAGKLARSVLQDPALDKAIVLAPSRFEATGAAFWINSASTETRVLGAGSWVNAADLQDFELVITVGDVNVVGSGSQIFGPGYALHWISSSTDYRFYLQSESPGYSLEGFSPRTSQGVWTVGTTSQIIFDIPLPRNAKVVLELEPSVASFGKNVSFVVGDDTRTAEIGVGSGVSQVVLQFSNSAPSDRLQIIFDEIRSDLELGTGFDALPRGLRVISLSVDAE